MRACFSAPVAGSAVSPAVAMGQPSSEPACADVRPVAWVAASRFAASQVVVTAEPTAV